MKKLLIVLVSLMLLSGTANAITWATSMSQIYAAGGLDVTIPAVDDYTSLSSIADPYGGTINFSPDVLKLSIPDTWADWSHGYTGPVLFSDFGVYSVRLDFDYSIFGWGMYTEPNDYDWYDMTLGLSDGSTITKNVYGDSGAEFFGFLDGNIDWLEISCPDYGGFAFSEMVMVKDGGVIPEPATLTLLGLGLLGLGAVRRRRK